MTKIQASRYHDLSVGHRVVGHESKCRHLHGHNYRIHFYCEALEYQLNLDLGESDSNIPKLDSVGRVIDFSVIKEKLCMWLEDNWDHKFLFWTEDPICDFLYYAPVGKEPFKNSQIIQQSFVRVPFNPTAENMADYLLNVVAPKQLEGLGVVCTKVIIEETRKCSVTAEL
ncbi:6-carboxy-5,6,7,8-tetrahydropterin synthase [Providencia phage PSTCR7]|uniref:6-carboxy-5,6,7,8-tetrahydropterin synthase n=1 Tax=Providencia phage PSTCR7 TaxID=2783549 RepID=A0A7S9SWB5_9CAUD|nr:QueD-like 6-pyruvoyl-tetrahydropterin synthase [Providencia phage PSTCR7]QPI18459.1 6-carboxy-5,6,7,8-tetrahydropterin synthase [Providencia phage PSTCR7]